MTDQQIVVQNSPNVTLIDKVSFINNVVTQATNLYMEAEQLQGSAKKERQSAKSKKKWRIWAPLIALVAGFFQFSIFSPILAIIVAIICIPACNPKKQIQKAEEYEKNAEEKLNSANMLIQKHADDLVIIPQQYWYPMATNYIVELFRTGRATTMPIALDKLEEQIHRWNMEAVMQQTLANQMVQTQMLRNIQVNTATSVAADVADLFL